MIRILQTPAPAPSALALALAVSLSACAHAPAPVAETQAVAEPVKPAGPALWKVADEDTTIYLFGTIHVLPGEVEWYNTAVSEALDRSDTLVTEIPMGKEADAQAQQLLLASGMLPEGTTLRSLLDEEEKAAYEAALTKLSVPAAAFDRFEPWAAGITVTVLPLLQQGYSADAGVDKRLDELAGPDKQRGALETVEFQIGIFDSMEQDTQVDFLIAAAEMVDDTKAVLDAMVAEWLEGDADALAALMNEEMDDPAVAEALLFTRNANWAEWIDTRLDQPGTVFMAVGAGHLAGERSVQDLLAARGIPTQRVQ